MKSTTNQLIKPTKLCEKRFIKPSINYKKIIEIILKENNISGDK